MKFGIKIPKKLISTRTNMKRQIVKQAGLKVSKSYRWVRDPKKYTYNKVYQRTAF